MVDPVLKSGGTCDACCDACCCTIDVGDVIDPVVF